MPGNCGTISNVIMLLSSRLKFLSFDFSCFDVLKLICRDVELTEKLDYSSAVALVGYSLILAILRVFNVRDEAARVMIAAPIVAFVTTHILYLNFYQLDHGMSPFSMTLLNTA